MTLPAIFVSHGAPTLVIEQTPARAFLSALGARLGRPQAVLVISAHWETARPAINDVVRNDTIHDFYGFPPELYQMSYPAPGGGALVGRVAELLAAAGLPLDRDTGRGLDHGAWVPLTLMYPDADLPVAQLSVLPQQAPAVHMALGAALRPLRDDGVLVLASGSFTHNLRELNWRQPNGAEPAWASDFAGWMDAALMEKRLDDLAAYRSRAPQAVRNHPTDEHLLPLYVALGAGTPDGAVERLHSSRQFGSLRYDAYAFH